MGIINNFDINKINENSITPEMEEDMENHNLDEQMDFNNMFSDELNIDEIMKEVQDEHVVEEFELDIGYDIEIEEDYSQYEYNADNFNISKGYLDNENIYTFKTTQDIKKEIQTLLLDKRVKEYVESLMFENPGLILFNIWNNNFFNLAKKEFYKIEKESIFFRQLANYDYNELKKFLFKDDEEFIFNFYVYLKTLKHSYNAEIVENDFNNNKVDLIIRDFKNFDFQKFQKGLKNDN